MKSCLTAILMITLLCSCSLSTEKKAKKLIRKVEDIGIADFERIEFGSRGDLDLYTYWFNDSTAYIWSFNNDNDEFDLKTHPNFARFEAEVGDAEGYAQKLRKHIKSLKVEIIGQAPWKGNLIRFWVTENRIVSYVNPEFVFDDPYKQNWEHDLKMGNWLKENWCLLKKERIRFDQ